MPGCVSPQPGDLGLQVPVFLLEQQDLANAGHVEASAGQPADLLQPGDVIAAVAPGAPGAAGWLQEPFPLVKSQGLRMQAGDLGGDGDAKQALVQVRPAGVYHGQPGHSPRCKRAAAQIVGAGSSGRCGLTSAVVLGSGSTRTGPAHSAGAAVRCGLPAAPRPAGRTPAGLATGPGRAGPGTACPCRARSYPARRAGSPSTW